MAEFKSAYEYDSLESFMNDRYNMKFNRGVMELIKAIAKVNN